MKRCDDYFEAKSLSVPVTGRALTLQTKLTSASLDPPASASRMLGLQSTPADSFQVGSLVQPRITRVEELPAFGWPVSMSVGDCLHVY